MAALMTVSLMSGTNVFASDKQDTQTQITLYAAKSLNKVLEDAIIPAFNEEYPDVKISGSYDSSGTLMEQIESAGGVGIDVFFSAAQKQMDQLEGEDLIEKDTRADIVNNQVCVVSYPDSGTKVTGLKNLGDAASLALAAGSVPVGKYTRQALVSAGMLQAPADGDVSMIDTASVSKALGGVEINECANVGAVTDAVAQHSNEVGTVYYSDTYGLEKDLQILEKVSYDLTGDVIYPAAVVNNKEADADQKAAAEAFTEFLTSDQAKKIFTAYYFDTNVGDEAGSETESE